MIYKLCMVEIDIVQYIVGIKLVVIFFKNIGEYDFGGFGWVGIVI